MVDRENNPRILEDRSMKTIGIKILKFMPVLLVWVMATGCIFSQMDDSSDKLQGVFIEVKVSADEVTKSTPAVDAGAESAINSVRIYAFYNGQLSGHYLRETPSDEAIIMDLQLPDRGTHNVDFYVIANEASIIPVEGSAVLDSNTSQEQLKALCLGDIASPDVNGLPLYYNGVVGINVDNLSSETPTGAHQNHFFLSQKVDVKLERPISKIAVYAAQSEEGNQVYTKDNPELSITKVEIMNVPSAGYLFNVNGAAVEMDSDYVSDTDVAVINVIGEQNGQAVTAAQNYTQVMAPVYFFENVNGGVAWSAGYVEDQTNLQQISQGAMVVKIGYSYDGGATSSYSYVKMPKVNRNSFYQILCRFMPAGGHQEVLISINEWDYVKHTFDEIVVKSK